MNQKAERIALVAGQVIDGVGREPIKGGVVIIEDGRVVKVTGENRIPRGVKVIDCGDATAMPGLIDCHVHMTLSGFSLPRLLSTPRSVQLLEVVPNSLETLRAGVTTVRDAGFTPAGVRIAIDRGFFPGPRMLVAVQALSQTGGHVDPFMPCGCMLPYDPGIDVPSGVVDGTDQMRRVVRTMLRAGADWIKLCTSGGVLSSSDSPDAAQFSVPEIQVAVEEAAEQGKLCMAHAISARGIKNALRAGVASIEHGCFLDEEGIDMMRKQGAYLVPTLKAPLDVLAIAARQPQAIPEHMVAKAREVSVRHREAFGAAVAAGVQIAMGTDAGVAPHGENGHEISLMIQYGLDPMAAIQASTATASQLLGLSDMVGTLEAGKLADITVVAGDPLHDATLFDNPDHVRMVLRSGHVLKDTRQR